MTKQLNKAPKEKKGLHPRNKNKGFYDFEQLVLALPSLAPFIEINRHGNPSINFSDPHAVKSLNQAILKLDYHIDQWDIPEGYLCPPIPGRADYIHHIADLLADSNSGQIPRGRRVLGLDIGVGANCIYPLIGCREYDWSFVGSDTDPVSVNTAKLIATSNNLLKGRIETRLQPKASQIFNGIIKPQEYFDFTLCNPPFHASEEDAKSGSQRKVNNLARSRGEHIAPTKAKGVTLNFSGQSGELWCEGGELGFIYRMVVQSREFAEQCYWFTTLVSKKENLASIYKMLNKQPVTAVKTIDMTQGNKISRFVCWSYLTEQQRLLWKSSRWQG